MLCIFTYLTSKVQKYKYFCKVACFLTSFLHHNLGGKYYVKNDVKSLLVWANRTNFAARKFNQTNW